MVEQIGNPLLNPFGLAGLRLLGLRGAPSRQNRLLGLDPSSTVRDYISLALRRLRRRPLVLALRIAILSEQTMGGLGAYSARRMVGPKATPAA